MYLSLHHNFVSVVRPSSSLLRENYASFTVAGVIDPNEKQAGGWRKVDHGMKGS